MLRLDGDQDPVPLLLSTHIDYIDIHIEIWGGSKYWNISQYLFYFKKK